jgi:UDP-N-acetylmuramate--alanine ligase
LNIDRIHIAHFIGIGGIGMSALARWFRHRGVLVSGYDRTETPLTRQLESEGISVHYRDDINLIPHNMQDAREDCLVVYTPAIPADHRQLNFLRQRGHNVIKRSEVLGEITKRLFTIAVAGTHGKTTTTSMIACILKYSKRDMIAFLGGILQQYDTNLLIEGEGKEHAIAVVEADEYDRSFLRLQPDMAVVTSMDADHLDIYSDQERLREAFREFIAKVASSGFLLIHEKIQAHAGTPAATTGYYGMEGGMCHAENIRVEGRFYFFDYREGDYVLQNIRMHVPGYHNVENAVAAIAICRRIGVDGGAIREALESYRGVKRRFEFIIERKSIVYIDDYAHHPEEISALIRSVRALYENKKITAVFQPHLFSRTRDFAGGFAASLDLADEVVLLDIYPAREQPIEGVDSGLIFGMMKNAHAIRCSDQLLVRTLQTLDLEVLLTVGAGDIDRFVEPIRDMLEKDYHDAA